MPNINDLINNILSDEPEENEESLSPKTDGITVTVPKSDALKEHGVPDPAEMNMQIDEIVNEKLVETGVIDDIDALIAEAAGENDEPEEEEVVTGDDLVTEPDPEEYRTSVNESDERVVGADAHIAVNTPQEPSQLFTEGAGDEAIELPSFTSDEIMEQIDIRRFGTLVKLKTQRWHARIKDKEAARKQAQAAGANDETYESYKNLLAGCDEKLKRIHKAIDAARTAHYALTLPWSTVSLNDHGKRAGPRLLPNTLFMEYTTAMAQAKAEMDEALSDFETDYPNLVAMAQTKMGTAFNPTDYPHMDVVRQHFGLHFDFDPIPKGSDFDGIQKQMADRLAQTLDSKTRTSLENAMQEAWHRLYTTVGHAAEALGNPDKTFHYTLVNKLREQATMLRHLNATGDQRIEDCRVAVENGLTKYDPKDIRKDDALRKTLADRAKKIYADMRDHIDEA